MNQYQFSEQDFSYMTRAIELAKQGRFTTTPNPNVGCVLVKNDVIVGEGFHQVAGQGHAEVKKSIDQDIGQNDRCIRDRRAADFFNGVGHDVNPLCWSGFYGTARRARKRVPSLCRLSVAF